MEELPSFDVVREIRHRARRVVSDQNRAQDQGWANFAGLLRTLPLESSGIDVGNRNELINRMEQNSIFGTSDRLVDSRSTLSSGHLLRNESQKMALIVILIALATYTMCIAVLLVRHMRRDLGTATWRRNRNRSGQHFVEHEENAHNEEDDDDCEDEEEEEFIEYEDEFRKDVSRYSPETTDNTLNADKVQTIVEVDSTTVANQCLERKLKFPRLLNRGRQGSIKKKTQCRILIRNKARHLPSTSTWTPSMKCVAIKPNKKIGRSECYL